MIGNPYYQQVQDLAPQYGMDPSQAARWVNQESGFNPNATSSAGAHGLTQLMPGTAADLGVDLNDPTQQLHGGLRYWKQQMDTFKDPTLAYAAYNAGPKRVQQFIDSGRPLPAETVSYVKNITGSSIGNNAQPASPMAAAMTPTQGTPPMAPQQQPQAPSLSAQFMAGGPGALFGAPNDNYDLGRSLQGIGAGLVTAGGDASGGAALLNAANAPLFRQRFTVVKDALGNQRVFDLRRGGFTDQMPGGAGAPGADPAATTQQNPDVSTQLAQTPVALAKRAEQEQTDTAKTMSDMQSRAEAAKRLQDKVAEMQDLLKDPNISTGGFAEAKQMAKNAIYGATGYDVGGTNQGAAFDKDASQLQGLYLAGQKGVRFAGPEISFSETANPGLNKPLAANQQILQDLHRNAQMDIDAYAIARKHQAANGVLGPAFRQELAQHFANTPTAQAGAVQPGNNVQRPPLTNFFQ